MLKYALSKQGQKCLYIAMKSFDAIYEAIAWVNDLIAKSDVAR